MADDIVKVTLTNTDQGGPRGLFTKGGIHTVFGPGETLEVQLDKAEYEDLPEHFEEAKKAAPKGKEPTEAELKAEFEALDPDAKKVGYDAWLKARNEAKK